MKTINLNWIYQNAWNAYAVYMDMFKHFKKKEKLIYNIINIQDYYNWMIKTRLVNNIVFKFITKYKTFN